MGPTDRVVIGGADKSRDWKRAHDLRVEAYRFYLCRLWNTGSSAFADDDKRKFTFP
jgi:hypothetical protein